MKCTDGNKYGSECFYNCDDGYGLSEVLDHVRICEDARDGTIYGKWTSPAATCEGW